MRNSKNINATARWITGITAGVCTLWVLGGCVATKTEVSPYPGSQPAKEQAPRAGLEQERIVWAEPQQEVKPEAPVKDVLMPTLTMINDRIFAYEQKLKEIEALKLEAESRSNTSREQLQLIDHCRRQVTDVLVEYNALHERLLKKTELPAAQLLAGDSLLRISDKDIEFLESDCLQGFGTTQAVASPMVGQSAITSLHADEKILKDAFNQGDYVKVINRYEQLPLEAGQRPAFDITFLYGQALLKTQREIEARKIFNDLLTVIRDQDQAQWEFRLMQLIGDLEFGLEIYDGARIRYKEINSVYDALSVKNSWANQQLTALDINRYQSDEIKAYAALLKSYLGYNPGRDGYSVVEQIEAYIQQFPYSPVSSNADFLLEMAQKQADDWLASILQRIDELAEQKKFQEALLLIERVPKGILPVAKQEALRRKSEQLITSESIVIETDRLVQEQELEEDWNRGMTLLEGKKYDEAIEVFTNLLASSYEAKARMRIDEAAFLAANEDRQRAAELFVRANRTVDLESKKKLLFASRQLLQDILIKYPQAGLSDKVKRNLLRIEEEIGRLDPTLLSVPTTVGGSS